MLVGYICVVLVFCVKKFLQKKSEKCHNYKAYFCMGITSILAINKPANVNCNLIFHRDICPLLKHPEAFSAAIDLLTSHIKDTYPNVELIVGRF